VTVAAKSTGSARHWLGAFMRSVSGSAAAEMALIFPIFGYVAINVFDFGTYAYAKMETDAAAQAAVGEVRNLCTTTAQLPATTKCSAAYTNSTTPTAAITNAARSTSLGTGVTIQSTAEGYYCATAAGALIPAHSSSDANCSLTTGAPSTSTSAPGDYISITVSYTYVSVFPGATVATPPLLPSPITRTAWMRLQ